MKKQILFLAMLVLAIVANVNKSYGQTYTNYLTGAAACTPALPLDCVVEDALHPLPGKSYPYTVTINPATVQSIRWFVTDVSNVIAAATLTATHDTEGGDYILDTDAAIYDIPANTTATINVAWKSFNAATKQVLLVAYVTGESGCSDNIEVFRIEPTFGFTLDIAGLLDAGGLGAVECVSPVESATYDGTSLTMNYGENWVFFSVNAANFVNSWQPSFTSAVTGGSTAGTVQWAYPADALANTNWHPAADPVLAQIAGGAVGPTGECIVLRVQIDHGNNELDAGVAAAVVTVGVNGIMFDSAALPAAAYTNGALKDLDNAATAPCTNLLTDEATYTLTPRPAITTAVTGGFEPKL